jgi:membrane-associated PAP2 superfamily phosphatase
VNDVTSPEAPLLVTFVLLVPAALLGAGFGILVRRHSGIEPATRTATTTPTGLLLTLALIVVVVGGVVLGALGLLVHSNSSLLRIDHSVAPWGQQHMTDLAQSMLDFVTSFGSTAVIVGTAIGVFAYEMVRRPSRWLPIFLAAVVIGQTTLSTEIKNLLDRTRPTANPLAHTLGPAFPSGHTTAAAACFAAFALVLGRGRSRNTQAVLAGVAVFVACAVAASRVLLGVHWLTDVLGGLALGWAWFALCSIAVGGRLLRPATPVDTVPRT